jgi:hypothetical protein
MNINEPREPISTEGGQFGDDDHVEVLVEDLFIEDYQTPLTLVPKPERRRARVARVMRTRATSLIGGVAAIGGLVLATMFFTGRRRKTSALARVFLKLGLAR